MRVCVRVCVCGVAVRLWRCVAARVWRRVRGGGGGGGVCVCVRVLFFASPIDRARKGERMCVGRIAELVVVAVVVVAACVCVLCVCVPLP